MMGGSGWYRPWGRGGGDGTREEEGGGRAPREVEGAGGAGHASRVRRPRRNQAEEEMGPAATGGGGDRWPREEAGAGGVGHGMAAGHRRRR